MSRTERKLGTISLILVAVLILTALFNVAYAGNIASASRESAAPSLVQNRFEKTDLNTDSLREQYINQELLQKDVASFDGDRWVIVALEGATLYEKFKVSSRYSDFPEYCASVEGKTAEKSLKIAQTDFLKKLDRHGIDYEYKNSYTAINNAVAIKINAEAYNAVKKMNGVKDVYYVEYYQEPKAVAVENNANVYTTGIYDSSDLDYKGEGMVVAILDTGLDRTHEAFQTDPKDGGAWDKNYIQNAIDGGGLKAVGTADDFFYSKKVPFAYDYADDDANVYPSYSSHGTHVAGIVAGKSDYVVNKETGETFVGVAPEAQLVICKVFTDNFDSESLGGANTMSILDALNDCTKLGVDVINMSLGTSAGFADEKSDTYLNGIYQAIEDNGISLVVAASNDYSSGYGGGNGTNLASNPDSGTVGAPSTYHSALSVASINGQKSAYIAADNKDPNVDNPVAFVTNSSNEYGQEFKFIEQLYEIASKKRGTPVAKGTELRFKYVVTLGTGQYNSSINYQLSQKDGYDGTIALIQRGNNTFAEKITDAMGTDADAAIIYNNVAGTIRMSLGEIDDPIPACSITMDAGKAFVDLAGRSRVGTIIVNSDYEAGPFMSDFSSWGPTPDLQLKPEITAHGGEITSAVAGGYDKYSGTSMASPNMAGAVAILRQYLRAEYGLEGTELNARVNQVLMSTATIANNEVGNPYSPRKQGAGLAGIADAINAEGYLTVLDQKTKTISDKTKIELGHNPDKDGVYEFDFFINNVTDVAQIYSPKTYVMTETMSSDNKTVAERAYMLNDMCEITYKTGPDANNLTPRTGNITVSPNSTLTVRVKIVLGEEAKAYLDANFKNGMYVEGFVSLAGVSPTKVTLGLPYLAFYGDWTDAPLFDYDEYEIAESEKDTSVPQEKKLKPSAAATSVVGRYYEDKYMLPLGTYIYTQDEAEVQVYPEREKIAISGFDDEAGHTIYELYMVYAGLLRGAAYMDVVITDDATGEIIYEDKLENVRKSYAGGGGNIGAPVMLELNPSQWGLANNSTYSVFIKGQLDYEGGENPERNSFEFPFTIDYEEPEMLGYRIRYMSYTENKEVKYKIFMDVDVRDNQFVQAVLPCYRDTRPDGLGGTEDVITLLTEYPIPVMGRRGETSTVSFEITDIYEQYVKTGLMYIEVDDYAMNSTNYLIMPGQIQGADAMGDPETLVFKEDDSLTKMNEYTDALGTKYSEYTLVLGPNNLYRFATETEDVVLRAMTWEIEDGKENVVKAYGDEVFTGAGGRARMTLKSTTTDPEQQKTFAVVNVIISGTPGNPAVLTGIKLDSVLNKEGYATSLNSTTTTPELELNPGQVVTFTWNWNPWYADKPNVSWESEDETIATVTQDGVLTPLKRGSTYVTVTAETLPGNPRVSKTVKIVVGREYRVSSYTLYEYFGTGEIEIPSNLNIMYLSEDCFKGNTEITKVTLPSTLTEIPEEAFMGCTNLEEIVIPGQCIAIKQLAFANCTSLKKITLGKFVDSNKNEIVDKDGKRYNGTLSIGRGVFYNCSSLTTIENQERLTTLYDYAFQDCTKLGAIDLSELRVAGKGVFSGCTSLNNITVSADTALGKNMFSGCTSLINFNFKGKTVPSGMFSGCSVLENVTFTSDLSYIASEAFSNTNIKNITLQSGNVTFAADAFKGSKLQSITLTALTQLTFEKGTPFTGCNSFTQYKGASAIYDIVDGVLFDKSGALVSVPTGKTSFTMPNTVRTVKAGALSGVNVASIDLSNVTNIEQYAFAGNTVITSVKLPSGLAIIPEGLFDGCTALASVTANDNFSSLIKIEANAFRGCKALESLSMAAVTEIGDEAFMGSGIKAVPSAIVQKIGDSAFEGSALENISLLALVKVGERAFANASKLKTATFGGIESMGEKLFMGSGALNTVVFGEGTKEIAAGAFFAEDGNRTALSVTLPSTVKKIKELAFYGQLGLTTIDLSNVEYVYEMAFCNTNLVNVDLSNLIEIGGAAFAFTTIRQANLEKAEVVGYAAFNSVESLTSVTFGALKTIGSNAFAGTSITTVTLPASFDDRTYTYEWQTKDEKGNVEDNKSREELNYSSAAFAGASKLKEIKASGNVFFDIDGVLYSRVKNGLVLEQYPAARPAKESDGRYVVADGTIIIADEAFAYVNALEKVRLLYTVKTIGCNAFFGSSVKDYVFDSVEAPTLRTGIFDENSFADGDDMQIIFGRSDMGIDYGPYALTNFYANFSDFAILADESIWTKEFIEQFGHFGLTMTIPLNATGYGRIWKLFFEDINYTAEIMPEEATHKAMDAIDALLPRMNEIGQMTFEEVKVDGSYGKLAVDARIAYNAVNEAEQKAMLAERLQKLIAIEKALRDRKASLTGHSVKITRLVETKSPNKYRYQAGDEFDPTGMVLTAIYEDGSEVLLEGGNYDFSPRILVAGTTAVTITYRDGNDSITAEIAVQVTVPSVDPNPPEPVDPNPPVIDEKDDGLTKGEIIGISVGVVAGVLVIAAVVVVVIVLKKKKAAAPCDGEINEKSEAAENESQEEGEPENVEEIKSAEETETDNEIAEEPNAETVENGDSAIEEAENTVEETELDNESALQDAENTQSDETLTADDASLDTGDKDNE